jgi:ankyrin repeat protein
VKSLDYSRIDIHANGAFQLACGNGHLDVVKFLLSLEPERGRIDIHAGNFLVFDVITSKSAFQLACCNGHLDVVKYLISLEPDHGRINIHADDEYAFRWACSDNHLNVVKFLLSLESDHGRINIHACDELAFRWACSDNHLNVVKFLLSLESDHGRIDIHCRSDSAFNDCNFHIKHLLLRRDPNYNWKNEYGYDKYCKELDQIVECLALLHQKMIQIDTDILELNVIGIVQEFLLG